MKSTAFTLLLAAALAAAPAIAADATLPDDGPKAEAFLAEHYPLGSRIDQVQPFLEKMGFECADRDDKAFEGKVRPGSYIYCALETPFGYLLGRRWQVALVVSHHRVREYKVNYTVFARRT